MLVQSRRLAVGVLSLALSACAQGGGEDGGTTPMTDAGPPAATCATATCDPVATCDDSSGSAICTCPDGYTGDGITCTEIDECDGGAAGCDANATCMNNAGGFECVCNMGFTGDGMTCTDIDECAMGTAGCDVNAACTNTDGGFMCECNAGWMGDGSTCTDEDECMSGSATCDPMAVCTNTPGGFMCACPMGFTGDGFTCNDVDECTSSSPPCDTNAMCMNTPGAFMCTCNTGWMGDGLSCTDVDECASSATNDCDANATCTNTPGTFTCACNPGFTGDGRTCTAAPCTMVDDFEGSSTWPRAPWVVNAAGGMIVTTPTRPGGGTRVLQDPGWHYRTDVSTGTVGDRLEAWVRSSGSGRVYLGFGASAGGCRSVVFAPNTNGLLIQENTGYGYTDRASATVTYAANTWYRLEAAFLAGNQVRATVYNTAGGVVATTTFTFPSPSTGGVALRSFNTMYTDDIQLCR